MESKMLSIRSFEKNQTLLGLINKIIIHIKLKSLSIDNKINQSEIQKAKEDLINFLQTIIDLTDDDYKGTKILTGVDFRERTFIRSFIEAKNRPQKFKSILFKKSPSDVIKLLKDPNQENSQALIDSLSDLRTLIDEHLSVDVKDLVGDI